MDQNNILNFSGYSLTRVLNDEFFSSGMDLDYKTLIIEYNILNETFKTRGTAALDLHETIIKTVLQMPQEKILNSISQNKKETYTIELYYDVTNKTTDVSSDTGHRAIRDGILVSYINHLNQNGYSSNKP